MSTQLEITPLRFGPDDAGRLVTADEFRTADFEEGFIYERVRGRLVVMPPAGPDDRYVSRPFRRKLGGYWDTHPQLIDDDTTPLLPGLSVPMNEVFGECGDSQER